MEVDKKFYLKSDTRKKSLGKISITGCKYCSTKIILKHRSEMQDEYLENAWTVVREGL